jgi:hypothetical protein
MADPGRGIVSEDEALEVLANPGVTYTGIDGKLNVLGQVGDKRIRICFVEEADQIRVIIVINRGPIT